jgi:hypothetical protein
MRWSTSILAALEELNKDHPTHALGAAWVFFHRGRGKVSLFDKFYGCPVLAFGSFTLKEQMLAFCSLEEENWRPESFSGV